MNILFTGVGRRVELIQAFRETALVLNKKLKIYGADMAGTAPALAYCDYTRKVVSMRDPKYIDCLINICKSDKIDLVIPTIDTDLLALSHARERFTQIGTRVMISSPDMVSICRDKNTTSGFFVSCGLKAPMPVNDWIVYAGGYPAFIKPKDGSSSVNAFKVMNEQELIHYANVIGDYVIQPFVDGREYTIDIFCDWDGRPVSIVPRERLQVRAGEVLKTKITMDAQMIEESRRLCEKFKPCGPITVQLIRDAEGNDWFIEINPRFGGGSPLSMKAGARSAEAILKLVDGETLGEYNDIEDGAVYSRFDQSVAIERGAGGVRGVIFDLDDTLFSEKEYVRSGYRAVSEYLGGDYEKQLWKHFEAGRPAIDELLRELGRESEKNAVLNIYRSHKPDIHLYEGVRELLTHLHDKNIKLGLITDGRPVGQRNKIEALGIVGLFDDIIVTDELGGEQFRKPCDIAFRIMATKWRMPVAQIAYIGDNPAKDFQGPKQLGMKCVWLKNANGVYDTDAEIAGVKVVREMGEIAGLL